MAWIIDLKAGEVLTVNGARIKNHTERRISLALLDRAEVVLPGGARRGVDGVTSVPEAESGNGLGPVQ